MHTPDARWALPLALLAVLSGCAGPKPAQPAVDTAAITAAVDSLDQAMSAAVAARDTSAIVNFYADDAHLLPASMVRADGKDAIRKAWVGFLGMPDLELTLASGQKLISEAGDMVVDIGSYDLKGKGPKGKPMHDVGKYVTVFMKVNGEWKVVVDTWNSDMPTPGPAK